MDQPGTLIKFGKLEHLQQLRDEGLLYMNNLMYFRNLGDNEHRGDPFEGASQVISGPRATMVMPDGNEVTICKNYTFEMLPSEPEKINIFCMYALRPLIDGAFPVDIKNQQLGDHALILLNRDEFIQRIEINLKSQNIEGSAELIEYVEDKYTGERGLFRKIDKYSFQYEWRLVCKGGPGRERKIKIGSIQDISVILPVDEVNRQIQVHFEPSAELDRP